jgi:GNAT superfamily N-acetyltransferase
MMIRVCQGEDYALILAIINDAARVYEGVIPPDRWQDPYMPRSAFDTEVASGVTFFGAQAHGGLVGVMGYQDRGAVTLIRHAYVRPEAQRQGIGSRLLAHLKSLTAKPLLIGTWRAATWAIAFYQRHGFTLVGDEEKDRLLRRYWSIPERQVETSVVLADRRWHEIGDGDGGGR